MYHVRLLTPSCGVKKNQTNIEQIVFTVTFIRFVNSNKSVHKSKGANQMP